MGDQRRDDDRQRQRQNNPHARGQGAVIQHRHIAQKRHNAHEGKPQPQRQIHQLRNVACAHLNEPATRPG